MSLKDFYNQIVEGIPLECESDEDVRTLLTRKFCELLNSVEQIDENERWVGGNRFIAVKSLSDVCKLMIKCLDEIHSGFHHKAITTLDQCYEKKGFYVETIKSGSIFYRMRRNEYSQMFSVEDMFHIPFSKRYIIGTQRYSTPGVPCLYLSSRICGCWEELRRPRLSDCMISQFVLNQDIKVLNINLMTYENLNKGRITWLHLIPLIMSCMIKVKDETHKFKDEYVFPQLIMEWLLSSEVAKKENIRGVKYTSVKKKMSLGYTDEDYLCLALPAVSFESNATLNELFSLTEPTSDEIERIKKHKESIIPIAQTQYTTFEYLEDVLKDRNRFPLKHLETETINKTIKLDEFIGIFGDFVKEYDCIKTMVKQVENKQIKGVYRSVLQSIKKKIHQLYITCPDIQLENHTFHFLSCQNFDNDIRQLKLDIKEIKKNQIYTNEKV